MAEETPQMIPPRMTGHLSSLAPMSDPDFFELVRENGQILIQGLSCKITNTKSRRFQRSGYFPQSSNAIIQPEGETSGANRSKDRVADSAFGHPLSSGLTVLPESQHHRDKNMMNSYPNCKLRNSSLQANYLEVLSELYEDDSNAVLKPNKNCYDEQLMDSHIVPVNNFKFFKQSRLSKKLVQEIPHHTAVNSDFEVPDDDHPNSSKQCEASVPFMRSKEPDTERRDRVNFSIFLKSSSLLKSIHQSSGATRPTSNSPGLRGAKEDILRGNVRSDPRNSDPFEMMPFEQTPMSRNINLMASNMKPVLPDSEPQKDTLPDEQSEAVGHRDTPPSSRFSNKAHGATPNYIVLKENPSNGKSAEQMVSASSACSRGASNNPTYTLKRRYEDTDLSEETNYTTDEHEAEATTKAAPARGSKGAKRKRKAEVHNLSERKRRDKINKKMRALRELIPNCNKVNKASMLDEAIEYLKTLQLQVQMMSMGNGVYMPPNPMMLPTIMQQMNVQHLAGTYSPMAAAGMGMRMQMGMGMGVGMGCSPAQFPTLPGITEAPLTNMMGFSPGQVLMMSMSRSPFASLGAARFCPQSVQGPAAATQVELPGAAPIPQSTSKVSN